MVVSLKAPNHEAKEFDSILTAFQDKAAWNSATSLSITDEYIPRCIGVTFPPLLQVLYALKTEGIETLGLLPLRIRSVTIKSSKLNTLKGLICKAHTELQEVRVPDNSLTDLNVSWPNTVVSIEASFNAIQELCEAFPSSLQELGLRSNRLKIFPPCLMNLSDAVRVDLSQNNFWFTAYENLSLNKKIDDNLINIARRFFGTAVATRLQDARYRQARTPEGRAYVDPPIRVLPTTIGQGRLTSEQLHNVHKSSVQDSVNKSLEYITSYKKPRDVNFVLKMQIRYFVRKAGLRFWRYPQISYFISVVRKNCADNTVHSRHGLTLSELLERIWAIAQDHVHRNAIEDVIWDEVLSGNGHCFTGRFSRLVNSLSGFVEEVQVGISEREQFSDAVVVALRKCIEEADGDEEEYRRLGKIRVQALLNEYEIPCDDHEAWLDAI